MVAGHRQGKPTIIGRPAPTAILGLEQLTAATVRVAGAPSQDRRSTHRYDRYRHSTMHEWIVHNHVSA